MINFISEARKEKNAILGVGEKQVDRLFKWANGKYFGLTGIVSVIITRVL